MQQPRLGWLKRNGVGPPSRICQGQREECDGEQDERICLHVLPR
jgi:hypothetical protein